MTYATVRPALQYSLAQLQAKGQMPEGIVEAWNGILREISPSGPPQNLRDPSSPVETEMEHGEEV